RFLSRCINQTLGGGNQSSNSALGPRGTLSVVSGNSSCSEAQYTPKWAVRKDFNRSKMIENDTSTRGGLANVKAPIIALSLSPVPGLRPILAHALYTENNTTTWSPGRQSHVPSVNDTDKLASPRSRNAYLYEEVRSEFISSTVPQDGSG